MAVVALERLEVRTPVAVVFATRTQLLEAVTSLPEQLKPISHPDEIIGGRIVFTPRSGAIVHGLKAEYHLPPNFPSISPSNRTVPTFSLALNNWEGMGDDRLKQADDEVRRGGKPEQAIAVLNYVDQIQRFGADFFPRLLSTGYQPEYATFSGIRTRLGNKINRVILACKRITLDQEVPTLTVGRRGHTNTWVERVIQEFGTEPWYLDGG